MPLVRPTLQQLIDRAKANIASNLGLGPLLRRGALPAIGTAQAGMSHQLFGNIDWASKQFLPDTAELEFLERIGTLRGVTRKAGTFATGSVVLTGTNGATIAAGTALQRSDGWPYATTVLMTISGGSATVPVQSTQAGADGNCLAGTVILLSSPVSGYNASGLVASGDLTGGADLETDDQLRARIEFAYANPPAGGSVTDYITWTLQVAGVTRAWCLPNYLGAGTVGVTFAVDGDPVSIIPTAAEVATVQAYLNGLAPATASVDVFAPSLVSVPFTIHIVPDNQALRDAVTASLADLLLREGGPGATIPLSHVNESIALTPGVYDHVLTVPSADLAFTSSQLPAVGTVTWT